MLREVIRWQKQLYGRQIWIVLLNRRRQKINLSYSISLTPVELVANKWMP
jgi:hypothetical protein